MFLTLCTLFMMHLAMFLPLHWYISFQLEPAIWLGGHVIFALSGIFCCLHRYFRKENSAKCRGEDERLVGFIIARLTTLAESDSEDRNLLGLAGGSLDKEQAVYILTLGTLPALRNKVGEHSIKVIFNCSICFRA